MDRDETCHRGQLQFETFGRVESKALLEIKGDSTTLRFSSELASGHTILFHWKPFAIQEAKGLRPMDSLQSLNSLHSLDSSQLTEAALIGQAKLKHDMDIESDLWYIHNLPSLCTGTWKIALHHKLTLDHIITFPFPFRAVNKPPAQILNVQVDNNAEGSISFFKSLTGGKQTNHFVQYAFNSAAGAIESANQSEFYWTRIKQFIHLFCPTHRHGTSPAKYSNSSLSQMKASRCRRAMDVAMISATLYKSLRCLALKSR